MGALQKIACIGDGPDHALKDLELQHAPLSIGDQGGLLRGHAELPQAPPGGLRGQILKVAQALPCCHALCAPDQPGPV
jgi:hypothetical protein